MSNQDQALARTMAHVLAACAPLQWFNVALLGIACWPLVRHGGVDGAIAVIVCLGLAAWSQLLHYRLALDARLFTDFVHGRCEPDQLDQCLLQLGLRKQVAEASMAQRCIGAMRLWRKLWGATLLQCVGAAVAWLI